MPASSKMARAHQAPRCTHTKSDGLRCQSPALKGKALCYFHSRIRYPRGGHMLRRLDDGNSVQVTILQAVRALREGTIDPKSAGILLWGLQLASANLKNVTLEALQHPVLPKDITGRERKEVNARNLTTENTEDAEECIDSSLRSE